MQIYNCVSNTLHSNHCQTSLTCLQRTRATIPRSDSQQQWPWLASICRGAAAVCRVTTILICPRLNCRILHQLPHLAEGLHLEERGFAVRAALPEDGRVGPRQPAHHQPHLRRREVPIHWLPNCCYHQPHSLLPVCRILSACCRSKSIDEVFISFQLQFCWLSLRLFKDKNFGKFQFAFSNFKPMLGVLIEYTASTSHKLRRVRTMTIMLAARIKRKNIGNIFYDQRNIFAKVYLYLFAGLCTLSGPRARSRGPVCLTTTCSGHKETASKLFLWKSLTLRGTLTRWDE